MLGNGFQLLDSHQLQSYRASKSNSSKKLLFGIGRMKTTTKALSDVISSCYFFLQPDASYSVVSRERSSRWRLAGREGWRVSRDAREEKFTLDRVSTG